MSNIFTLLFSFQGRINRFPFWVVVLILAGSNSASQQMVTGYGPDNPMTVGPGLVAILGFVVSLWIGFAVQVKRWHDRDKSGWWALISLVPIVGWIWVLIECGILPGTPGGNQYGEGPIRFTSST